jgi:uncharacterized protein (TIRG00374 family)
VGLTLLFRQIGRLGWGEVSSAMAGVPIGVVAAVLGLTGSRFLVWAVRWRRLMGGGRRPGFGKTVGVILASTSIAHTLPFGRLPAGLARARLAADRTGQRTSTVYGTVLMDQSLISAAGLIFVAMGLGFFLRKGMDASRMPGGPWTWVVLAVLFVTALLLLPMLRKNGEESETEPTSRWSRLRTGFLDSLSRPLDALVGVLLSATMILLTICAELLVLRSLGEGLPVSAAIAAVALGGMLGTVAGSPGGLGISEAASIEIYAGFGVEGQAAAATVLVSRAMHLLWVLGVGSVCLATLGGRSGGFSPASPARDPRPGHPPRG